MSPPKKEAYSSAHLSSGGLIGSINNICDRIWYAVRIVSNFMPVGKKGKPQGQGARQAWKHLCAWDEYQNTINLMFFVCVCVCICPCSSAWFWDRGAVWELCEEWPSIKKCAGCCSFWASLHAWWWAPAPTGKMQRTHWQTIPEDYFVFTAFYLQYLLRHIYLLPEIHSFALPVERW